MRTSLPNPRPNGHPPLPSKVFVITGMCQNPRFRVRFQNAAPDDLCYIFLGAAAFGAPAAPEPPVGAEDDDAGRDPYFVVRRRFDNGQAAVTLRVDWEGVFTLLANDDGCAEAVYRELIEPSEPEEVVREWSEDQSALRMFADWMELL